MLETGLRGGADSLSRRRPTQIIWITVAVVAGLQVSFVAAVADGVFSASLAGPAYPVTFSETGLRIGNSWSVSLNGKSEASSTPTIRFVAVNGTYSFVVRGTGPNSTASPESGKVTVSGASTNVSVSFSQPPQPQFPLTFSEDGLPPGTPWSVTISWGYILEWGSQIMFQVPNGNYPFTVTPVPGFIPTPANGSVTIAGHSVLVHITFESAPVYPLTFNESGLPPGSAWYVTLDYTSSPTTNSSHTFWLSNGTYPYLVGPGYADGGIWDAKPSNGTAVIHGEGISVPVRFYPAEWWAIFTETGLPVGTWWSVNITASGNASEGGGTSGGSMIFLLPNGTYGFVIGKISGYSASPSDGSFKISGSAFNVTIQFVASSPSAPEPLAEKGGPPISESWSKATLAANAQTRRSVQFAGHA